MSGKNKSGCRRQNRNGHRLLYGSQIYQLYSQLEEQGNCLKQDNRSSLMHNKIRRG